MVYTSEPIYISSFIRTYLPTVFIFGDQECLEKKEKKRIVLSSHIFIFLLHVSLSLDTFYRGPLVMFWKAVAKPFQNNDLRCENEAMQSYWREHCW